MIPVSTRFVAVLEMSLTTLEANLTAAEGGEVCRDEHQRAVALRCNPVATQAAIDPALPCADSPTVASVLVN